MLPSNNHMANQKTTSSTLQYHQLIQKQIRLVAIQCSKVFSQHQRVTTPTVPKNTPQESTPKLREEPPKHQTKTTDPQPPKRKTPLEKSRQQRRDKDSRRFKPLDLHRKFPNKNRPEAQKSPETPHLSTPKESTKNTIEWPQSTDSSEHSDPENKKDMAQNES